MSEDITDSGTLSQGAQISLPNFKEWNMDHIYDYAKQVADYSSLEELNTNINAARLALFKATRAINRYERLEREAKALYDRSYRREFIKSTEKTSEGRRMRADLVCEELENNWMVAEQTRKELERLSYALRLELQTLQGVSNNYRQQMRME